MTIGVMVSVGDARWCVFQKNQTNEKSVNTINTIVRVGNFGTKPTFSRRTRQVASRSTCHTMLANDHPCAYSPGNFFSQRRLSWLTHSTW